MTQPELNIPPGEAHLWCCSPDEASDPGLLASYLSMLTPHEEDRYHRYHFEKDRILFLVTRALVRTTLSRYSTRSPAQWRFEPNAHGKPHLLPPCPHLEDVSFNLTNTQGLVALLLARSTSCGVDAEYLNRPLRYLSLADKFFSADEVTNLQAQPPAQQAERFLTYWTLKESFIKAEGKGLAIPLDSFSMRLDKVAPRIEFHSYPGNPKDWQLERHRIREDHLLALALHRPDLPDFNIKLHFTVPLQPERDIIAKAP